MVKIDLHLTEVDNRGGFVSLLGACSPQKNLLPVLEIYLYINDCFISHFTQSDAPSLVKINN